MVSMIETSFSRYKAIYMKIEPTSTASPAFVTTLLEAAASFRGSMQKRPSAIAVVIALLEAEKAAKQQRLTYPLASLIGRWRLCFVTTAKVKEQAGIVKGRGWYVPKFLAKAHISFSNPAQTSVENPNAAEIGNQLEVGAVNLKLTGPAQYLDKKNILAFDFTQMQFSLLGRLIYSGKFGKSQVKAEDFYRQPIANLAFFAFFLITDEFIAARGRGGGLALWIREN